MSDTDTSNEFVTQVSRRCRLSQPDVLDPAGPRRGRPRSTSRRELQLIALRLFTEQGFETTTIEQIAAEAGVSERTFFRYFGSKASVLWTEFESEVAAIGAALAQSPEDVPMMDAIRAAVVSANHYHAEDVLQMRMRMNLIATVPALSASAAEHYDSWERAISEFAGQRLGQPADSLYPLAVGRAALAACRAAYDRWSARADNDLTVYLDAALTALAAGFAPSMLADLGGTAQQYGGSRQGRGPDQPPLA
jgi:TetR/AcrR family transcriptional regulator, regulator of mycofactocin system